MTVNKNTTYFLAQIAQYDRISQTRKRLSLLVNFCQKKIRSCSLLGFYLFALAKFCPYVSAIYSIKRKWYNHSSQRCRKRVRVRKFTPFSSYYVQCVQFRDSAFSYRRNIRPIHYVIDTALFKVFGKAIMPTIVSRI